MAGYTRQSSFADGDIISAADSNDEFNQILAAFVNTSGHKHDGTAAEGPVIGLIGDPGVATPINKVVVDDTNNQVEFNIDVGGVSTEQFVVKDGLIEPTTNNDIDLGSSSKKFKDLHIAGAANIAGTITLAGNVIVSGTLGADLIPDGDNTRDIGSSSAEWKDLFIDGTANIDSLVADTADINGGTIDATVIGGSTAAAITGTTVIANTSINIAGDGATVTGIKDEDDMASNSATKLATQQSIKAYVDDKTGQANLNTELGNITENVTIGDANDVQVTIAGDLVVSGTTTTVNSTTVNLNDHNIVLDSGNNTAAVVNGAGITIEGGSGDDATFTYNTTGPKFELKLGTNYEDLQVDGIIAASLTLGGTAVTSTAAELNILDGVTATASEINILDGVTSTTAELNILDGVTSTAAEINKLDGFTGVVADLNYAKDLRATGVTTTEFNVLDGITATVLELNLLDGVTATTNELNILDGVTATASEINILDGVTATTSELNILDGVTATAAELNYSDGVTSNIQTQLDAKEATANKLTKKLSGDGSATTYNIVHNFGTPIVMVQVLDYGDNGTGASYDVVQVEVQRNDDNSVDLIFAAAPSTSQDYLVLISKFPAIS